MRRLLAGLATCLLVATGCGGDGTGAGGGGGRLDVVASFYPVTEAARAVGGDLVTVTTLTPAGAEPHDLELTPDQVDRIEDADVVLYVGRGFQPAVEEIARRRRGWSVDLLEAVDLEAGDLEAGDLEPGAGDEDGVDPHFWLDPTLLAEAVGLVEEALAGAEPSHAGTFAANAGRYRQRLAALDREFQEALRGCRRRLFVTSHAAFHYLARRYGLEQVPIAGLSPESEPGPDRLGELADLIAARGVTTVFYETLVAPDVAETLAREAGVRTAVLNPLEGLTTAAIEAGKDYAAVMRENVAALTVALGCR